MTTNNAIRLIAKWINDSIPAGDIDRLTDHIHNDRYDNQETYDLAEKVLKAIDEQQ